MAVDSAFKRCSATHFLIPGFAKGVFPGGAGVSQAERQDVSWCYGGILAGAGAGVTIPIFEYHYRMLETN